MISTVQLEDRQLQTELAQLPLALRAAVERGLGRATELLRAAVTSLAAEPFGSAASAFGEFAGSVATSVTDDSGRPIGQVFLTPPADRYGIFVEVGTRPHFPPPAALEGWVRRRLGIPPGRQARELAFLIGRKIARQGTAGRFFFQRALEQNTDRVVAVLEREIAKALA